MALTLDGYRIHTVRLPYNRPLQWVNHAEDGLDLLYSFWRRKKGWAE